MLWSLWFVFWLYEYSNFLEKRKGLIERIFQFFCIKYVDECCEKCLRKCTAGWTITDVTQRAKLLKSFSICIKTKVHSLITTQVKFKAILLIKRSFRDVSEMTHCFQVYFLIWQQNGKQAGSAISISIIIKYRLHNYGTYGILSNGIYLRKIIITFLNRNIF